MKKNRTLRIALFAVAAVIFITLMITEPTKSAPAHPYYAADASYPFVIAHKGGNGLWPGNTMYAFQHAVVLGVDVIETDVHVSKDGVLVLMHDDRVDYNTNGSGLIEDLTLSDLKKLDDAYKWSPDNGKSFPYRGMGITIPTLEEAFQAFPNQRFVLDVKRTSTPIESQICELIRKYNKKDQVVVASLYDDIQIRFRQVCPEVASSAAFGEVAMYVLTEKSHLDGWIPSEYESLQGPIDPFGIYDALIVTKGYIQNAHARNLRVEPWVNDADSMKLYIDYGVDGIITDRPDIALQILNRRQVFICPSCAAPSKTGH